MNQENRKLSHPWEMEIEGQRKIITINNIIEAIHAARSLIIREYSFNKEIRNDTRRRIFYKQHKAVMDKLIEKFTIMEEAAYKEKFQESIKEAMKEKKKNVELIIPSKIKEKK
jgi:hypothetical protein